jgi:hypothetical protein
MAGSKAYLSWLDDMKDLHVRKNAGYSPGDDPFKNFRGSEALGVPAWKGALIRMGDKYERVMALANNPDADQVGESIMDTLSDLAAYAGIVRALYIEAASLSDIAPDLVAAKHAKTASGCCLGDCGCFDGCLDCWVTCACFVKQTVSPGTRCCYHKGSYRRSCEPDCVDPGCAANPRCPCKLEAC